MKISPLFGLVGCLVLFTIVGCIQPARVSPFKAPTQETGYGKRRFCVAPSRLTIGTQFSCGNEYHVKTARVTDVSTVEIQERDGDVTLPTKTMPDSLCVQMNPEPTEQCGFPDAAPIGSTATLLSTKRMTFTLVAPDRVEIATEAFHVTVTYPFDSQGRAYLAEEGLPRNVIAGLR